jgi:choline dehydrogenase-like flavoprotein
MDWAVNPRAALSRPYDGRPACNYCGNCNRGCPIGDKGSADVTFARRAEKSGRCEIRTGAAAVVLETRGGGIRAVQYVADGRGHRVESPVVVLAAGAVETPRLLLANRSARFPHGLANGSGQVGRNLMETLHWVSTALARESLASFEGLPADAICWNYNAPDGVPGLVGGCRFTSSTQEAGFTGPISYASRIVRGFGPTLKQGVRDAFGRALTVGAIGEFLPNAETRVTLDESHRDERGMPFAKIHARLTANDIARLKFMAERCRASLKDAGAAELVEEYGSYDFFSAPHVAGTCRMGRDARASVVDPNGRTHEIANLYIADASVFPTAGGGEGPSLTIQALAIRTADLIARGKVLPASVRPALRTL